MVSRRGYRRAAVACAVSLATLIAALSLGASADAITFATTRLSGASGGTEPRIALGPDGRLWVATSRSGSRLAVYGSGPGGSGWTAPPTVPSRQLAPTIDVDIVATRTGRLIATELDFAALSTPVWYSDDDGGTWTSSVGTAYADQDRQFLAVGPDDPVTRLPRVYFAFHNLFSGLVSHNLFVATSIDGGATFGPPVPVTVPGTAAWLDMQCGDGGWPDGMGVDQATGRVYLWWATRSSSLGGCGAQPLEVNIVAGTKAWVASSPDASPGSWTTSVAVDNSESGRIVAAQFVSGAIDVAGYVYLLYTETPNAYPDYAGASVRYVWAPSDVSSWSEPVTIAPGGGAGHLLPHLVAGADGTIGAAFYTGEGPGPRWYLTAAVVTGARSGAPQITEQRVSDVAAYSGDAGLLMGACAGGGPAAGVEAGLLCSRITDVWGIALDSACRLAIVWPTAEGGFSAGSPSGTYVSQQTGGPALC